MAGSEGRRPQVVVVDAAGRLTDRTESALTDAGFGVETVTTASDCLDRIRAEDVDGVLSDFELPDLNGVQLLRSIRVSYPLLPFVLAPRTGSETIAGDAIAAGVSAYVPGDASAATVVSRFRDSLQQANRQGGAESTHRYRHVIEMSPAPINVFDGSGESIWCNDAVLELLGLDHPGELIGHSIFEFIHPDDHDLARSELAAVIENKQSTGPTAMKLRTKDGDVRYVRVSTAVGESLGTDIGQAIIVDLTDERERDRQLQLLEQWLRHNIRNESTVIHGMAESIEQGLADDVTDAARRIREHTSRLVKQANHERAVITLLSEPPEPVVVDLTSTVRERLETARDSHPDADIDMRATDGVSALAVPEVGDAVDELVENAVVHSDTDTPIVRVDVAHDDRGRPIVRVADTGPGIPERERRPLLADHEITQLDHGNGLGLLFVGWVARLSGGTVQFTENDPRGSVVTLTLPTSEQDVPE